MIISESGFKGFVNLLKEFKIIKLLIDETIDSICESSKGKSFDPLNIGG